MTPPAELLTLADYLTGEFENRAQAMAEPIWYVHLRLWQRPVSLFAEDSVTLFAEQANALYLDQPYRQRLMRISPLDQTTLRVQYYQFKDAATVKGGGQFPERLQNLTAEQITYLPGCVLTVRWKGTDHFFAEPIPDTCCYFSYEGEQRQVALGFEATATELVTYDRGIDPATGQALWGAVMGPYRFVRS